MQAIARCRALAPASTRLYRSCASASSQHQCPQGAQAAPHEADASATLIFATGVLAGLGFATLQGQSKGKHKIELPDEPVDDAILQASTKDLSKKPSSRIQAQVAKDTAQGCQKLHASVGPNKKLVEEREAVWKVLKDVPRMPELDYKPTRKYVESTAEKVLYPIIEKNELMLVCGGFFGDEGKGKTVDAIARHKDVKVVARVNSGENAGHTVIGPTGVKYHFHLCPSGLLTPGKMNCIGPECVMDPVSFMTREVSQLQETNVEYRDRLFIGNVHLVCPHHKLLDLMSSWASPNSSTLQGMAPVHASKVKRRGLRMDHLFGDKEVARKMLEIDLADYYGMMKNLGIDENKLYKVASQNDKIQKHTLDFIKAPDKAKYVLDLYDDWVVNNPHFPPRLDVSHTLRSTLAKREKVLLEGPQSYWLSNAAEKFWDSGTSACTDAAGMLAASRVNPQGTAMAIFNIHKTPGSSRVGAGACPTSFVPQNHFADTKANKDDFDGMKLDWKDVSSKYFKSVQSNGLVKPGIYQNSTGEYDLGVAMAAATCVHPTHREFGVTTGKPRVVGFFDCVAHCEMMAAQGPLNSIGALDRGDDYDAYGVCIAYVYVHPEGKDMMSNGRVFKSGQIIRAGEQLPTQAILRHCHPVVKVVRGWKDTPLFAGGDWWKNRKAPVALPDPVCEFLDIIEHFTGSEIVSIGNGPKGDHIIYIEKAK